MTGHLSAPSVAEIRAQLGLSQRDLATLVGCSQRALRRIENGYVLPSALFLIRLRAVARTRGLTGRTRGPIPVREYDEGKLRKYLGRPRDAGIDWHHASVHVRNSWRAQRARYARLYADLQAGRVMGQAVTAYLDAAPDLDSGV